MNDLALFVSKLIRNPRRISAVAPSSRQLAKAMAEGLGPETGRVVELGAGTGRLTRAILEAGVAPHDLTIFEVDRTFADHLRKTFPGCTIQNLGAEQVDQLVQPGVGAVVSGLPLLSMPLLVRMEILRAATRVLAPGAPFIQFTYGPKPPISALTARRLGLRIEPGRQVWVNLPPARIYRLYSV
jgi:phosphatidylethanolamine/phosphatidyl-N-methylethanolamine N-methyltransferase